MADEPLRASAASQRLLLVDNSDSTRRVLRSILAAAGWSTIDTSDAREALAYISAEHFDVVITDLEMTPLDGLTFIAALLHLPQERATPKIIVCSASISAPVMTNLGLLSIPTLEKPVDPRRLISAVRTALERT